MFTKTLPLMLAAIGLIATTSASCATAQDVSLTAEQHSKAEQELITAVAKSSRAWKEAFNAGDANAAAAMYEKDAVMVATPFGTIKGHDEIKAFWADLVKQGFDDVVYEKSTFKIIDDKTVSLSAEWTMNNAGGIITNELWVVQPDGNALMREDHFEVTK